MTMGIRESFSVLNLIDKDESLERYLKNLEEAKEKNKPAHEVLDAYIRVLKWMYQNEYWLELFPFADEVLQYRKEMGVAETNADGKLFFIAGQIFTEAGDYEQGGSYLLTARSAMLKSEGKPEMDLAQCCNLLGTIFLSGDNLEKANHFYEEATTFYCSYLENNSEDLARVYETIAESFLTAEVYDRAAKNYQRAVKVYRRRIRAAKGISREAVAERGRGFMRILNMYQKISACHKKMGNPFRAFAYGAISKIV